MIAKIALVCAIIFALAVLMTMTGRGGGNFYVLTLVLAGLPMHEAASTGQFILFVTALAAAFIFKRARVLSIKLAIFLGSITASMAFLGGLAAHLLSGRSLKLVFSALLVVAGILMLFRVEGRSRHERHAPGFWNLRQGSDLYVINLWVAVPLAMATGLFAGMVGVSGGSFLVPLMVLGCGVPMHVAVGTASAMVATTALAGFIGHAIEGAFNPTWALPAAAVTIAGGAIGGRIALRTKPRFLKTLFAVTTLAAAVVMLLNASLSK